MIQEEYVLIVATFINRLIIIPPNVILQFVIVGFYAETIFESLNDLCIFYIQNAITFLNLGQLVI